MTSPLKGPPESAGKPVRERTDPTPADGSGHPPINARRLQQVKIAMESVPDTDEEKVADVRSRIENGTYRIDARAIALKMLKEAVLYEDI